MKILSKKIFPTNDKTKYATVDDDIYETIQEMNLKFYINNKGYFMSTKWIQLPGMIKKKYLLLHRFVFILKTGEEPRSTIDHIDIDKSNNMFENLRLATRQQQQQHRGKQKSNTSGYIGVTHIHNVDKYKNKKYENDYWRVQIMSSSGHREVKYFPYTENGKQHAAMWYDTKTREYFGEFCGELNFPMPTD